MADSDLTQVWLAWATSSAFTGVYGTRAQAEAAVPNPDSWVYPVEVHR